MSSTSRVALHLLLLLHPFLPSFAVARLDVREARSGGHPVIVRVSQREQREYQTKSLWAKAHRRNQHRATTAHLSGTDGTRFVTHTIVHKWLMHVKYHIILVNIIISINPNY